MWDSKIARECGYIVLAVFATLLAFMTVGAMFVPFWPAVLYFYAFATSCRLFAGGFMNQMGDTDTVNAWNNTYHRRLVIALNAGVGFVLIGRLGWDAFQYHTHIGPLAFLISAFVVYFIAAKFTAPNTFGARVRSAILTVVLIGVMSHLAWPCQWGLWALIGVIVFNITLLRLHALQRRFGWADR